MLPEGSKTRTVVLPPDLDSWLVDLAQSRTTSVSALVRQILAEARDGA